MLLFRNKTDLSNSSIFGAETKTLVLLNSDARASFFLVHQRLNGFGFPRHFSVGITEHN